MTSKKRLPATIAERWKHIVEFALNGTPIPMDEQLQGHVALASIGVTCIRNADREELQKLQDTFFAMVGGEEDMVQ